MKPDTLITRAAKLDRKKSLADLLAAVEDMPNKGKAALVSRIMKEVVAGRISPTEANEITKAVKV